MQILIRSHSLEALILRHWKIIQFGGGVNEEGGGGEKGRELKGELDNDSADCHELVRLDLIDLGFLAGTTVLSCCHSL